MQNEEIEEKEVSEYGNTIHGEVARLVDEEGMDWSEALAWCNID